jgi:hemolysin III
VGFPALVSQLGVTATSLIVLGGVLYSAGAAVYALRRPDPMPEVFHALVIAAAVAHDVVVALYGLPRG